jgi:arylsulfatase A-like enzyme
MNKIRLILALFAFLPASLKAQQKPNIILILADDLRSDALGCYGNGYVKTPNIDKLAQNGTKFTNTYIAGGDQGAICSPSRAMLMTGKSYHRISNKVKGENTIPKVLRNNGYQTLMTGKWHNEKEGVIEGFTQAKNIMFGGMDDHFRTPMVDLKQDKSFTEIERKGFSTDVFAQTAIDFIDQQTTNQPFFLYVPFTAPHDPRSPKPDYLAKYNSENIPLPPNFKALHPFSFGYPMGGRDEFLSVHPRTPDDIKAQIADYYALITHLDDVIGDILSKLKAKGLDKNTLVIFAADNGLALGSHGLMGKQNLYEHSMKIPMIFSGLNIPKGKEVSGFSYLFDVFPTICKYLKINAPTDLDGLPLNDIIFGKTNQIRNSIFTSYIDAQRAVRNERFKFIRYPKIDHQQLFDLKNDPFELVDLSKNADYQPVVKDMTELLLKNQQQYTDKLPLTAAKIEPKEWDYRTLKRVPDQWQPAYTLDKYFNLKSSN